MIAYAATILLSGKGQKPIGLDAHLGVIPWRLVLVLDIQHVSCMDGRTDLGPTNSP